VPDLFSAPVQMAEETPVHATGNSAAPCSQMTSF